MFTIVNAQCNLDVGDVNGLICAWANRLDSSEDWIKVSIHGIKLGLNRNLFQLILQG